MIEIYCQTHNLAALADRMKALPVAIGTKMLDRSLMKGSVPLRDDVRSRAPRQQKTHWSDYQGGRLQNDIQSRRGQASWLKNQSQAAAPGTARVYVGASRAGKNRAAFYANMVEFGHGSPEGYVEPRPFFRPAFEATHEQVVYTFAEELTKELERYLRSQR